MKFITLLVLFIALYTPNVFAEDRANHTYVDLVCCSYHFKQRDYDWNEFNPGVNVRHYVSESAFGNVTVYKNSVYRTSVMVGGGYTWDLSKNVDFSLSAGLVTGYLKYDVFPYLLPSVTLYDRIHFSFIPAIDDNPPVLGLTITVAKF